LFGGGFVTWSVTVMEVPKYPGAVTRASPSYSPGGRSTAFGAISTTEDQVVKVTVGLMVIHDWLAVTSNVEGGP